MMMVAATLETHHLIHMQILFEELWRHRQTHIVVCVGHFSFPPPEAHADLIPVFPQNRT